ncbi:hypothetical protein V8E36_005871 [Tilletia maclaganii]
MAIPRSLSSGLLPSEIEYIASTETEVSIVPLLAFDRVRLLGGIYGPFRPPAQAKVPLWLAAYLKKRNKCIIVPPPWLTVEALSDTLRIETTNPSFAEVPFHYVAVAKVLLDVAADDIASSDQVRALLKDLREARQSKIMAGLEMINPVHLEMTNISALEIAELRPFFRTAFKQLRSFQRTAAIANREDEGAAGVQQQFGMGPGGGGGAGPGPGLGGDDYNNNYSFGDDDFGQPRGGYGNADGGGGLGRSMHEPRGAEEDDDDEIAYESR